MAVSIPATRVTRFIDQLIDVYGQPTAIRCEFWRYNEIRPHDALGSLPPARYREKLLAAMSTLKLSTSLGSLHAIPYYFIVPQPIPVWFVARHTWRAALVLALGLLP